MIVLKNEVVIGIRVNDELAEISTIRTKELNFFNSWYGDLKGNHIQEVANIEVINSKLLPD